MALKLPLKVGDRVVAAFPFCDQVYIVTERGHVIEMVIDYDAVHHVTRLRVIDQG